MGMSQSSVQMDGGDDAITQSTATTTAEDADVHEEDSPGSTPPAGTSEKHAEPTANGDDTRAISPRKTTGDTPPPIITPAAVVSVRSALKRRLQHDVVNDFRFVGDAECAQVLESLFARTIESGQNQSGLLIGSAGFGSKQIVACALRRLRARFGTFTLVYLNGVILQNEVEAFKEMLAQLTRNRALKHPVLSYSSMYSYLRQLLRRRAAAREPVLVILDGLEHFAHKSTAKQLLLYNLLDWLQFKDVQMGVLGVTTDFCIMDSLEKRVRSRFSKLQIVIPVRSFDQTKAMLRQAFTLRTIDWTHPSLAHLERPAPAYIAAFDRRVDELLGTEIPRDHQGTSDDAATAMATTRRRFQAILQGHWDKTRSPEYFVRLAVSVVSYLSTERALLAAHHFQRALYLLEPDHQLATLRAVSHHGVALLIGMSHLEQAGHSVFTLEMVYRKWEDFYRKHDLLAQMPTRTEAQLELETLIQLQLVSDAGDPFRISRTKFAPHHSVQPEYRAVNLSFEPKTLQGMIRNGSIQCPTAMTEWMLNGGS